MSAKPASGKLARAVRHVIEQLEQRVMLAVNVEGIPDWTERGPGPVTGSYVAGIPNQPVTGAVSAIATHPTNANTIWIGTAGGGIWRTTDGGSTWEPKTDQFPSLAITSIAVDPANPNILWAGTGSISSSGWPGRTSGLLKSSDGGETWRVFESQLASNNRTVHAVVPTRVTQGSGRVVLAASQATATTGGTLTGGVLRSTDGGFGGFRWVSGAAGSNLPRGTVTDLKGDPGPATADQSRVYAALPGQGVYRSDDAGATWTPLNAALTAAGAQLGISTRIKLAVSEAAAPNGNRPVYAMIIQPVQGNHAGNPPANNQIIVPAATLIALGDEVHFWRNTTFAGPFLEKHRVIGSVASGANLTLTLNGTLANTYSTGQVVFSGNGRVSGVFRSDDFGATWQSMGVPADADGGIFPSKQGDRHGSILADRSNPNVVYLGGDTQVPAGPDNILGTADDAWPNAAGAMNWTGRLFSGTFNPAPPVSTTWTSITHTNAQNSGTPTAPHPDSRVMVFDANNDILQGDDGGIYKLDNPGAGQFWSSVNGNLRLTELYSVAWNPVTDRILGGAQDNGFVRQSNTFSLAWDNVIGGDGAIAATTAGGLEAYSVQNLGFFTVGNSRPTLSVAGTGSSPMSLSAFDNTVQFVQPYVFNTVSTRPRLLIGTEWLYESEASDDAGAGLGNTLTLLGSDPIALSGGRFRRPNSLGRVGAVKANAMVYGGMQGGAAMPDIGWVGTDGSPSGRQLWVRQAGKNTGFKAVHSWNTKGGNRAVVAIAVDPIDWRHVYVLDSNFQIWFSDDGDQPVADSTKWQWQDLTNQSNTLANLPGARNFKDIAVLRSGSQRALLVGGEGGVFRRIDTVGATPANGMWSEFGGGPIVGGNPLPGGGGLPNAVVTDLDVDTTDNQVLVGTMGRGTFTASTDDLFKPGKITVTVGSANSSGHVIRLRRDERRPWLLNVYDYPVGAAEQPPTVVVPITSVDTITINGGPGPDQIFVDYSFGPISLPNAVAVHGGGGTDALSIVGPTRGRYKATKKTPPAAGPLKISIIESKDFAGVSGTQTVVWNTGDLETQPAPVQLASALDSIGSGLNDTSNSFQKGLSSVAAGTAIAAVQTKSVAGGLSGVRINQPRPKDDQFFSVTSVGPDEQVQIDNATSILRRLIEEGLNAFAIGSIDSEEGEIASLTALRAALDGLDDVPGNVTLDTTTDVDQDGSADTTFTVAVVNRRLDGIVNLDVNADGTFGQVRLFGALEVDARVDLNLVFGADDDGFFIKPSAAGAPAVRVSDIKSTGAVLGSGRFGFLGVDVDAATLTVDPDVGVEFSLRDPGTEAADGLIRFTELSPTDFANLVTVAVDADPGDATPDVILAGTFSASAAVPGLDAGIPLLGANVELRWADLAKPTDVSLHAATGSTGAKVLEFLKVTTPQVLDQLKALRGHLDTLAKGPMKVDVSLVQDAINDVARVIELIDRKIVNPLDGGGNVVEGISTIQDFVATLAGELAIPVDTLAYDPASGELTYRVDLHETLASTASPVNIGYDLASGVSFQTTASAAVNGQFDLGFVFGIDVGGIAAGGAVLDNVFLSNATMGVAATVNVADLDVAARLGFVGLTSTDGTANGSATVGIALKDPNSTATRLTMRALGSAITSRPLDLLVGRAATLSGSASIDLRNITINGLPGISPAPGARITLSIADLRAPTNIAVQTIGLDNLADFNSINGEDVLRALVSLAEYLATLKSAPFMSAKVPFTSKTLGDVVDFNAAVSRNLLSALQDAQGKPTAATAQALADKLAAALGLPLGTINALYDAATRVLTFRVILAADLDPVQAPVGFGASLGPVDVLSAQTNLALSARANLDFVFGADLSRRTVSITATGDAPANGRITTDAHFQLKLGADNPVSVTVRADATNASIDDLVADINAALATAGLAASVVAGRDGNKLKLSTTPALTRPRITLNATATDSAITQLRFANGASATDDIAGRFFIRDASASGSVTAAANDIRLGARLGFLDIGIENGTANLNAAVSLRLQPPGGPPGGQVAISRLVAAILSDPLGVVASPTVTGTAAMDLPIVVEGNVLGPIAGSPQLVVRWTDITNPSTLTATLNGAPSLDDLRELDFADVLNALKNVATYFLQLKGYSFLDQKLPLLNRSISDLVTFAEDFAAKVEAFEEDPAGSLQELALKLARSMGLPTGGVTLSLAAKELKIGFDLPKSVTLSRQLDLDLADLVDQLPAGHPARGFLQGIAGVLDVQGSANLSLAADALVSLHLGIDLTNPSSPRPFLYNRSGVTLGARAGGTNLNFTTAMGPLGVFVRNGSASIDGDGNAATTGDKALFTATLAGDPNGRTYLSDLGLDDANVTLTGQVKATLPLFFPTQSNAIGDLTFAITNLGNIPGTISMSAPDLVAAASSLDLINNLGLVIDGLDILLAGIQRGLNNSVFSNKLPLIGDGLSSGGQFIQDFRSRVVAELHAALDGAGDKAVGLVQDAILKALGPAGLGLLQDVSNDGSVTIDDVPAVFTDTDGNNAVDQVQFDLRLRKAMSVIDTPIDFDAGLPGLGLTIDGRVLARLSFDFALSFGVSSRTGIGFYVDTSRANELTVNLEAGMPGLRAAGRLGPLRLDATDSAANPSNLTAAFTIDLLDPTTPGGPPADDRLTYNEVTSDLDLGRVVSANLAADAAVNLALVLGYGAGAKFPSFASDFELRWRFNPGDGMRGAVPTVAFKNVRMDLGSFIGNFVGPVLSKIRDITAPLQPALDFITRPVPVLSDLLGRPTSLVDIANSANAAAAFGRSVPADIRFITSLAGVANLINTVPTVPVNTFIPLGSFDLTGVDVRALPDLSQAMPNVTDTRNADAAIQQTGARDFYNATKNVGGTGSGLSFPILNNPSDAFKLLMGQDVDVVTYDMAPLSLGFEYGHSFTFPAGPLPIAITVRLGAAFNAFANFDVGFDTRGIRTAIETGNPTDVFGGFYLRHQQGVPEFGISGSINASAEAGVIVADFGLKGEVKASLSAGLRDLDKDGKVYLDEFVTNLDHGLLCTFDVTGAVTAGLKAYVTLGVWPVSTTYDWVLAERTLVDWQLSHDDCYSIRFEPNDFREFAADIGVGPGIHLDNVALASPTDRDWYKFTVLRPTDSINVQAIFRNAAGNIDIDVVTPDGRLLGRSATSRDRELVTLQDVQPGTYYVHVYGHMPETQPNNYKLYVDPGPGSRTRVFYIGNATAANQYYTQGRGDDANDGTDFTRPKATLASLLTAHDLGPDDIVLFDTGTYAGAATITADDEGAIYAGSPGSSKLLGPGTRIAVNDADGNLFYRLSFEGSGGTGIHLVGDGVDDAENNLVLESTFKVLSGTGVRIDSGRPNSIRGNTFAGGSTGISLAPRAVSTVDGNDISLAATGISVESTGSTFSGNEIHHNGAGVAINGRGVFGPGASGTPNDIHHNTTGINVFSTATNAVVRSNRVHDNTTGVSTASATSSILGNEIYRNTVGLTGVGTLGPVDWSDPNDIYENVTGVLALASSPTATTVVRFNRVHGNTTGVQLANGAVARNNVIYRNTGRGVLVSGANGAQVVHNTVYEPSADGIHVAAGSSNALIRNNIVWVQAGYGLRVDLNSQAGFDSDYNNLFASGSGRIGWWQKDFTDLYGWMVEVKSDLHSIGYTPLDPTLDDPRFVNVAADDFHVADFVSTGIDSGDPASAFDLEPAPAGTRVDLGAYGNTAEASKAPTSYIRLDSPNFHEDWEADQGHTIRWHTHNVTGSVTIDLYTADGTKVATLGTAQASASAFQWTPRDSGIVGDSTKRYRIRISAGKTVAQTREWLSVPTAGGDFYLNDGSTSGDVYTTAAGNLRNTGKTAADPKTVLAGLMREYDLGPGDTIRVDTGHYLHVRDAVISGNILINDDEAVTITGPTDVSKVATFDRGGAPGGLPLSLNDGDFVTLRHLTLTGGQYGLWLRNASVRFTGSNLTLFGNTLDGLRLEADATDVSLDRLAAFNNGRDGVSISAPFGTLSNSVSHHNGSAGFRLVNTGSSRLQRNESHDNAVGIHVENFPAGTQTLIGGADLAAGLGNRVHHNRGAGINAAGLVLIAGNAIHGHTAANQAGIVLGQTIQALNNVIFDNFDGIQAVFAAGNIANNRIYNNRRYGVTTVQVNNTISGNVIYSNGTGIYINSSTSVIANNLVYANATHGLLFNLAGAGTQVRNNTVYQEAGDAVHLENSPNSVALRNNVLWVTAGHALYFAKNSQPGASSDYNLFYTTGAGKVGFWQDAARTSFAAWRGASFLDAHSLFADPLFVGPRGPGGRLGYFSAADDGRDDDFHEQSTVGSFHGGSLAPVLDAATGLPVSAGGAFAADAVNSPALDRGRPTDAFANEPAPSGSFINLGAYGNTAQASRSIVPYVLVTNPDGGETLPGNQTFAVEWRADAYTGTVDIELLRAGSPDVVLLIADDAANNGSFAWRVPATLPEASDYLLRVRRNDLPALSDASNAPFSVVPPIRIYYVNDATFEAGDWTTAPGDDANDGLSPATPKASIRAMLEAYQFTAGDVIRVDSGRYPLTANIIITAADAGVKIEGYHDETNPGRVARIERGATTGGAFAFDLRGATGVTLDHLSITASEAGVFAANNSASHDLTVSNSVLFGNNNHGIYLGPGNSRASVLNNRLFGIPGGASADNQMTGIQVDGADAAIAGNEVSNFVNSGISVQGLRAAVTGNTVYGGGVGNVFGGISARGVAGGTTVVSGNTVYNVVNTGGINAGFNVLVSGNTVYGSPTGTGIYASDNARVTGNTVYGNLDGISAGFDAPFISGNRVFANSRYGLVATNTAGTLSGNRVYSNAIGVHAFALTGLITNNLIYANRQIGIRMTGGGSGRVFNNTVYQPAGDVLAADTPSNTLVRNNIFWAESGHVFNIGPVSQPSFNSDYNTVRVTGTGKAALWAGVAQQTLAAYQNASGQDLHSLGDDPRFNNPAGGDGVLGFVSAAAGAPQVLDDSAATFAGTWQTGTGRGVGGGYRSVPAGTAPASATWTFTGLAEGATYHVATTWPAVTGGGFVNVSLTDGTRQLYSTQYNQSPLPNDFTDAGVPWEVVSVVTATGTTLTITLSRQSGSPAIADAVRLVRVTGDGGADDDFHVQPSSPTVDRGHPLSHYHAEPQPSGDRVNQGYDGNTPEAQTSPAQLVQVMGPNGGEKLLAGVPVNVSWRTSGLTASRPVLLLDSGGNGADNFTADAFFTRTAFSSFAQAVDLSGVTDPAPMSLYQTFNIAQGGVGSAVSYRLPVPDGAYTLRLHFAEQLLLAADVRVFDIRVNGISVRSGFNIAAAAGGILKAVALTFPATASGGAGVAVDLVTANTRFEPAIVSGLELWAANPAGVASPTVDLDVSVDNGTTWSPIATAVAMDRFGRGTFVWTPDAATAGSTGLLRVRSNDGARPADVSDAPFLIAPAGGNYYVNDGSTDGDVFTTAAGDDANDGKSPGRPMASIISVLDQYDLGPGDVIHVDSGNYGLLRNILLRSGDSGITIRGPDGNTALLDRNDVSAFAFEVRGATGVTLDHLSITGARYGVWVTTGSHNFTLSNSTVFANAERGMVVDAAADFVSIDGNEFYGLTGASTDQNTSIQSSAPHATIAHNSVHNTGIGIHAIGRGQVGDLITVADNTVYSTGTGIEAIQGVLITRNTVRNNGGTGINLTRSSLATDNVVFGNGGHGIHIIESGSDATNNRVFANTGRGIWAVGDAWVTGNTVYSNGQGIFVEQFSGLLGNNLVYANASSGITLTGDGTAGRPAATVINNTVYQAAGNALVATPANVIRLRNNILWAENGSAIVVNGFTPLFNSDFNDLVLGAGPAARVATVDGKPIVTFDEWQDAGQDRRSISVDPMFVDFNGPDDLLGFSGGVDRGGDDNFHVRLGSPTVDRGDPQTHYLAEPGPNGSRINQGYDANTPDAQLSPAQTAQVLSPNGGERMTTGQQVAVTWRTSGLTAMRPVALINAGGGAVGAFSGDAYATSTPTSRATGRAVDLSGVTDPAPAAVYDTYASADGGGDALVYQLPVPAGTYTLRLHFVEPSAAAGTRRMEIRLNGTLVRENFDIAATAGGIGRGLVLDLPVMAGGMDGIALHLVSRLTPGFPAILSGIEVLAADPDGFAAPTADVDLSTDNGATWTPVATDVVLDRFGGGSATWTAGPATRGAWALVRVRASVGSRPQDVSDRPFFVAPAGRDFYLNDGSTAGDVFTTAPGSNANDGKTPATPMASLSLLLDAYDLGPGDVIHVDAGTYRLVRDVLITANDAGVRIEGPETGVALFDRTLKTTVAEAFEIRGAPGVTIDRLSITGAYTGVLIAAGSHNVTVSNGTVFANDYRGILVESGSDAVTISGNTVYGTTGGEAVDQDVGIRVEGTHALITGNVVSAAGTAGIELVANSGRIVDNEVLGSQAGLTIHRNGTEVITVSGNIVRNNRTHGIWSDLGSKLITGNTVYGNLGAGIQTSQGQVVNNVVYGNQHGIVANFNQVASVITGNRVFNNSGFGIHVVSNNSTIDGNLVYQNSVGFRGQSFGGVFTNNAVHSNTNQGVLLTGSIGARLFNNTVYQPVGDAVAVQTASTNVRVRNNILWTLAGYTLNVSADSQTGFASDYNDLVRGQAGGANVGFWGGAARATLADWQAASGQDAHSISADPKFVDLDGADNVLGYTNNGGGYDGGADDNFELSAGSPAIDRGDNAVAPARDLIGASRADDPGTPNSGAGVGFSDLGAYEFLGNTGDVTPPTVSATTPAEIHAGGTAGELTQIAVTFSEPVVLIDATAPANYELRGAGADGAFDTADDFVYTLSPQFTVGSRDVRLDIVGGTRASGRYRLTVYGQAGRGVHDASGVLLDGDGDGSAGGQYVREFNVVHKATVIGRHLFYNNSSLDGFAAAANAADDLAIATDKSALLPGQSAALRNVSSYDKGINGIMIDMKDLPAGGALSAADFIFRVGNSGDPASWQAGPAPASITIRRGGGVGGSDRVVIVFTDRSIRNHWLQVTIKAGAATNLAGPDVFYFGSLPGDTGGADTPLVNMTDVVRTRAAIGRTDAASKNNFDFNRDGVINAADVLVVRNNQRLTLTLFTAPATSAPTGTTDGTVTPARAARIQRRRSAWSEITQILSQQPAN